MLYCNALYMQFCDLKLQLQPQNLVVTAISILRKRGGHSRKQKGNRSNGRSNLEDMCSEQRWEEMESNNILRENFQFSLTATTEASMYATLTLRNERKEGKDGERKCESI